MRKRSCLNDDELCEAQTIAFVELPQEREQSEGTDTRGSWGDRLSVGMTIMITTWRMPAFVRYGQATMSP